VKRSGLITVLAILQLVAGLFFAGTAIYLIAETRNPEILKSQDAVGAVYGLKFAALAVSILAIPNFLAGIGLWRVKAWGRWLAVAINAVTLATLLYEPIFEHARMDLDDIGTALVFAGMLILFLLPVVGRHLRNDSAPAKTLPESGT
jgi:uncharacterized membrane protein (DUF2068 family)